MPRHFNEPYLGLCSVSPGRHQSTVEPFSRHAMSATLHKPFAIEHPSLGLECSSENRNAPKRVPRPPNAFLLYRSDFLKRQVVPPEVEKRQQNLSRIAGQCWKMLPETEKAIWFSKAAVIRAEHCTKYPSGKPGPFYKDTGKPFSKEKRRAHQPHPYKSPYSEGSCAACPDSSASYPAFPACLSSPTSALESPLSASPSLSPLTLPRLLPLFPSHWQNMFSTTSENLVTPRKKTCHFFNSSCSKAPQWHLDKMFQDGETIGVLTSMKTPAENSFRHQVASVPPQSHTAHQIVPQPVYLP